MVLNYGLVLFYQNGGNYFLTSHDTCICSSRGTKVTFWGAADGAGGLRERKGFNLRVEVGGWGVYNIHILVLYTMCITLARQVVHACTIHNTHCMT